MELDEYLKLNKRKKSHSHEEEDLQVRLVGWFKYTYPDAIICCTMGGLRLKMQVAIRAKKMGYHKGIPDLLIFEPCGKYAGLLMEVKTKDGQVSTDQKRTHERLRSKGYFVGVGYGFDECQQFIRGYMMKDE